MTLLPSSFSRSVDTERTVDLAQWLDRGIIAAVLLACAVALSLNVADPDLWGHVQYGRDALANGLPRTTTYSYAAADHRWINHEILAEYALAIGVDWLGGAGLLIVKCLLGMAIVGTILWRSRRQGAGLVSACALALLVALTLGNHWSLRPQIASYVCFTLLLALLSYCFHGWEGHWQLPASWIARLRGAWLGAAQQRGWQRATAGSDRGDEPPPLEYSLPRLKLLWLAPLLFLVWTNAHGGFLAGLCVYLAYLSFRGVEAYACKGRAADGLLLRFGLMGGAAAFATFLNPYGPLFHVWLLNDLAVPRPEIVEWRAPELLSTQFLPFWLLLVCAVASLAVSPRSRDFTHVAILVLIVSQALLHQRHIAFFALACGWWLPLHFDSLLEKLGVGRRFRTDEELRYGWAPPDNPALFAAFSPKIQQAIAVMLVLAICLGTGKLAPRLTTLKVERRDYPIAAAEFIADRGLTGKMVCTFNWAQYIVAAFGPREPGGPGILVQIDGRCRTAYPQELLDMHFDLILGPPDKQLRYRSRAAGPYDPSRVLEFQQPDLVLISRRQQPSVQVMEQQKADWVLLYQDALAQLWGHRSRYDDPASAYYVPPYQRRISESFRNGYARWPALPAYRPAAGPDQPARAVAGRGPTGRPHGL